MAIRCTKVFLVNRISISPFFYPKFKRYYHGVYGIPFYDFYQFTTGESLSEYMINKLRTKHPTLDTLSREQLQCSLQILKKFGVDPLDACCNPHVFCMNPISLDNYGEILKECRFAYIAPEHLISGLTCQPTCLQNESSSAMYGNQILNVTNKNIEWQFVVVLYHMPPVKCLEDDNLWYQTLVRSRTIAHHKKAGLIRDDIQLEEVLLNSFQDFPSRYKIIHGFDDTTTSIVSVRLSVLESFLTWKLSITPEEFKNYCRHYLPLKHKPMNDIQEALHIAEKEINFDLLTIRRNGFIISADPINTKLILENVKSLAGIDIREAVRIEPAILKNNYNSLLQIKDILKEYEIGQEAQQKCLKVFCMRPATVQERLDELRNQKEYNILSTNPRVLSMVIHKRKMMTRLSKMQAAKKQCFSLNHLVSSSKIFNEYISSFGDKVCGRDIAVLIVSSLTAHDDGMTLRSTEPLKFVLSRLKRHKFWLHASLNIVDDNIKFLQQRFRNKFIINNCQLLLYPVLDIEQYVDQLLSLRNGAPSEGHKKLDAFYNNLQCDQLTDDQILSLALYEIEKKYHFSGDGIWARQDGVKIERSSAS